jgi:hypothetical protein
MNVKYLAYSFLTKPAEEAGGPSLRSSDLVQWAVQNLLPLALLIIGGGIIAAARKGRMADNANTTVNVVWGLAFIASAGVLYGFAGELTGLAFGTG